jgi:hypothetical protein
VVASYLVKQEVDRFSKLWVADHDYTVHRDVMGPLDYIAEHSGINQRAIQRYLNEQITISESKAEAILMAIDRENLLKTGEIPIIPNPNWTLEKWLAWRAHQC